MKYLLVSAFWCFLACQTNAQERTKDEKWFIQTQFTYVKITKVVRDTFSPGTGVRIRELDASKSFLLSLHAIGGYFVIPRRLSLGIGFGWDGYYNPNLTTAPLYGDLRFYFTNEESIPYIFLNYGGYLKLGNSFSRGGAFRLGAGYKISLPGQVLMYIEAAITRAGISLTDEPYITADDTYRFEGIAFTFGFYLY